MTTFAVYPLVRGFLCHSLKTQEWLQRDKAKKKSGLLSHFEKNVVGWLVDFLLTFCTINVNMVTDHGQHFHNLPDKISGSATYK